MTKTKDNVAWVGVDLDGTLAEYHGKIHNYCIGKPIPRMMRRVRRWLRQGFRVKIFTARACWPSQTRLVRAWLRQHGLPDLEVTNRKDFCMLALWDDLCVQVVKNTGERADRLNKTKRTRMIKGVNNAERKTKSKPMHVGHS